MTEAQINRNEIDLYHLMNEVSFNNVTYDFLLYCSTPGGFGYNDGAYILTISYAGSSNKSITFITHYQNSRDGCLSLN